jgi:hypothetical protein
MTTRKPKGIQAPVIHSSIEILSIQDGAFKQAQANETLVDFAQYMIDHVKGFGTKGFKMSPETREELDNGYRLRFSQMKNNEPVTYAVIGDNYIPMDKLNPEQTDKVKEKVVIGVSVACSFTTHEFGKLKNERPQYHAVIGEWREKTSTYCSNRRKDLEKQAYNIVNGTAKGKRKANLNFGETVEQSIESLKTKLIKCVSLKDDTANQEKFNKALSAFLAVWKA